MLDYVETHASTHQKQRDEQTYTHMYTFHTRTHTRAHFFATHAKLMVKKCVWLGKNRKLLKQMIVEWYGPTPPVEDV
jgi:hypothetical protein